MNPRLLFGAAFSFVFGVKSLKIGLRFLIDLEYLIRSKTFEFKRATGKYGFMKTVFSSD